MIALLALFVFLAVHFVAAFTIDAHRNGVRHLLTRDYWC